MGAVGSRAERFVSRLRVNPGQGNAVRSSNVISAGSIPFMSDSAAIRALDNSKILKKHKK